MDTRSILSHAFSPLDFAGRCSDVMFTVPHIPLSISSRLKMASIALAGSIQGYVQATQLLAQSKTGPPGSAALTTAISRASEQSARYSTYVNSGMKSGPSELTRPHLHCQYRPDLPLE